MEHTLPVAIFSIKLHHDPGPKMISAKPPFLYIPGLDGTGRLIEWQKPLYGHYHVIALAYPQDRKTTYRELADAALEKLTSAAPDRKAVVLAESFGGGVAIRLALQHPERIERLILVNTFARFPGRLFARTGALFSWLLPPWPTGPLLKIVRGPMLFGRDLPASEKRKFWEAVKDVPMSAMGRRIRMLAQLDYRSELQKIEVPTLVVVSPQDKMVHPKASRELAALIPSAHLIEIPTGHASLIHPKTNVLEWLTDSRNWPVKSLAAPQ